MKKTQGEAKIALTILRKTQFQEVELKTKNVDNGIVEFANKNKDYVIATLDKEIQEKIKNYKLIIRGEKGIELSNQIINAKNPNRRTFKPIFVIKIKEKCFI